MICDKDSIVEYLYDELDAADRERFERHLASCGACRDEVASFRETRTALAEWTPPDVDLGFEIVRRPATIGRRASRFRMAPAWGLAAAAVLCLAVASAIANLEIEATSGGFTVRTGWGREAPAAAAASAAPAREVALAKSADVSVQPAAASLGTDAIEQRLRALEASVASRPSAASERDASASPLKQADVVRLVRQLIDESEKRQQGQLAVLIAQVHRDVDAVRRADFARIQQGLAQIQGANDAQVIWQRAMEDRILRAVQPPR